MLTQASEFQRSYHIDRMGDVLLRACPKESHILSLRDLSSLRSVRMTLADFSGATAILLLKN